MTGITHTRRPGAVALGALLGATLAGGALAAAPDANDKIGNQATATYTDGTGVTRTVLSNLVETTVSQIYGVAVTPTPSGSPSRSIRASGGTGTQVSLPHVVTNTGNGTDSYNLTVANVAGDSFDFTLASVKFYADADNDGIPDDLASPITMTPVLARGAAFSVIVVAPIPAGRADDDIGDLTVTATSAGDASVNDAVIDRVTVSDDAILTLTKSLSRTSGPAGTTNILVTLTYTNSGNNAATNVVIDDTLNSLFSLAGASPTEGSAEWSGALGTTLNSGAGGDPAGIDYTLNSGHPRFTIGSVPVSGSGFVRFRINVSGSAPPGAIPNQATIAYNDGSGTVNGASGIVNFVVDQSYAVAITNDSKTGIQGQPVFFDNTVTNNGNGGDIFNLSIGTSTFPAGTTFFLLDSSKVPLTNSNSGDAIPDTGLLASGGTFALKVKAILPPNASNPAPGTYTVQVIATSVRDPASSPASATGVDTLTALTVNSVDLQNDAAGGTGDGPGGATGEATAQDTETVDPGQTARFVLFIENTGPMAETYNLAVSTDNTFATQVLPTGWTVTFKDPSTSATISQTPSIAAGGNATVWADVFVPTGFAAGTRSLYFRARSPVTSAQDILHDAVAVNSVRRMTLEPDNTGQVFPGGSTVYSHTLRNDGNITEANVFMSNTDSQTGFISALFVDNGDGVLGAGDTSITATTNIGPMAPGAVKTILNSVTAAAGTAGLQNLTTLRVLSSSGGSLIPGGDSIATDTTDAVSGDLQLEKFQALDANCDGTEDGGGFVKTNFAVKPGECIRYRVEMLNSGTANATSVTLVDSAPAFTTVHAAGCTACGTGQPSVEIPAGNFAAVAPAGQTLTVNQGTLNVGALLKLHFGVRVDN